MTVQLQTAKGKIKKYQTIYVVGYSGGGEHSCGIPEKYAAKCGMEWKDEPKQNEQCDHLDCAIYLAEKERNGGPKAFAFFIAIGGIIILLWGPPGYLVVLTAFIFLINGLRAGKRLDELNEYKHKNTVNGIRAWRIYDNVKGWWQFWR